MKDSRSVLISYTNALADPPARQASNSLAMAGFKHLILHAPSDANAEMKMSQNIEVTVFRKIQCFQPLRPFIQVLNWLRFCHCVNYVLQSFKPDLVLTIMLNPLAALPLPQRGTSFKLAACVYDIPATPNLGKLDRLIAVRAWTKLSHAHLVWTSDIYKGQLAQQLGELRNIPFVCHNCPPRDYLPDSTLPRDTWLRDELRRQGAMRDQHGGSIMLRAGAIGECGGIEETLLAMRELPKQHLFLMIGRPMESYKNTLLRQIAELGLERRAFLWEKPNDELWKKALQGADIGHLIHGPFPPGPITRNYELNSSLSNNRLFQYMAAGLPIVSYDDPRLQGIHREVGCFRVAQVANLVESIRHQWRDLAANSAERSFLGQAARNAHLTKYNWEAQFAPVLERVNQQLN